ncbi:TolB family protein, partial [Candidatus Latescibacterota bacterium]
GYPGEFSHIYLKQVAGGDPILIHTYDQFAEQFKDDPEYNDFGHNSVGTITFTPESQEITFAISIFDEELGSVVEFRYDENGYYSGASTSGAIPYIKSININTGEVRDILMGGEDPLWDPTGRYLLYRNFDYRAYIDGLQPENQNIPMVLDTLTGESWVQCNESSGYDAITPDGQYILFWWHTPSVEEYMLSNGEMWTSFQVFRRPLTGGEAEQITYMNDDVLSIARIVLSPDGKWLFFSEGTDIWQDVDFSLDDDPFTRGGF